MGGGRTCENGGEDGGVKEGMVDLCLKLDTPPFVCSRKAGEAGVFPH